MKLIVCDLCHDVVQLKYEMRSCACENIKGNYIDNTNVEIHVKDDSKSRILGIDNRVRYGKIEQGGRVWVIKFNNETVKKLIKIGGESDENKRS